MPQTSSREQNLRLILALIWIGLTTIFVIYDISKNWWPARQVIDWQNKTLMILPENLHTFIKATIRSASARRAIRQY
jgi:hypothetical protein